MRRLPIICSFLLPLWACSSAPPAPTPQDAKLATPPAPKRYAPTDTDLQAAQAVLKELAQGAEDYFTSEQKHVEAEPWHPIPDDKGPSYQGFPVPWVQYTFPGGADFTMSSHPAPPQGGEPVMPSPSSSSDHMQATLNKLSFAWPNYPTRFQYTYELGPGRGDQSTATITARANFDTSNEALYTMTIRIEVDEQSQEVVVHPIETTPEGD